MKKILIGMLLVGIMMVMSGCGTPSQKEAIPYSKLSELETESIDSPEYLIEKFGQPNRTITEVKDMEAIVKGYIKNIDKPDSSGNVATDAVNKASYYDLIDLAEKRLEIISSLEESQNFKALEYKSISGNNEEYNNYYIFDEDEYIIIFWDLVPYAN